MEKNKYPVNLYDKEPITKNKSTARFDFIYLSLSQLEDEVRRTFPNEETTARSFLLDCVGALYLRLIHTELMKGSNVRDVCRNGR